MPAGVITAEELRERLDKGDVVVLDVREPWEVELAAIEGSLWIPLDELAARADEVPRDRDVVVVCHTGVRSAFAARSLSNKGVRAFNLRGGVDAWARDGDPEFPRY